MMSHETDGCSVRKQVFRGKCIKFRRASPEGKARM